MEIDILRLPDIEESTGINHIYSQLINLPSYSDIKSDYTRFKAYQFSIMDLSSTDSFIDSLNDLAKLGIEFLSGDYEFAFSEPATIEGKVVYQKNVSLGGVILEGKKIMAGEKDWEALIYQALENLDISEKKPLFDTNQSINDFIISNTITSTNDISSNKTVKKISKKKAKIATNIVNDAMSADILDESLGYGLLNDLVTINNLKDYNPLLVINKQEMQKRRLIELLHQRFNGVFLPYSDIESPDDVINTLLKERRKAPPLGPEYIEEEVEYGLDYLSFVNRANNLMRDPTTRLKQDIYFVAKEILQKSLKITTPRILEEIINNVYILTQKLMIKKDAFNKKKMKHFETQISLMLNLYVICCIHCIQNILKIKIPHATDFFIDLFREKNREDLLTLGITDEKIKAYYLESMVKVYDLISEENIKTQEEERAQNYKPIYNPDFQILGPKALVLGPKIRPPNEPVQLEVPYKIKVLKHNFKGFKERLFFDYYANFCPKHFEHVYHQAKLGEAKLGEAKPSATSSTSVCDCGYMKAFSIPENDSKIDKKKQEYYKQYKEDFKRERAIAPTTKLQTLKAPKSLNPKLSAKKIDTKILDQKIKELSLSYKIPEAHIFNITRTEDLKNINIKSEEPLTVNNLNKLKYYCLSKGIDFNYLNSGQSVEETFAQNMYSLLGVLKKDELTKIIEEEKKSLWVDINELLAQKGVLLDMSPQTDLQTGLHQTSLIDKDEVATNENLIAEDIIKGDPEIDNEIFDEIDYDGDDGDNDQ